MNGFEDHKLGQKKPSAIPIPNMKQATGMPQTAPSPFPSSGFARQGAVTAKPGLPKLMDEQ